MGAGDAKSVSIEVAGVIAAAALARPGKGRVLAVSDGSVYVESGGAIVCIGDPAIGHGPLNALAPLPAGQTWAELSIGDGDRVDIDGQRLAFARGPALNLAGLVTWSAPPWPAVPARRRLEASLGQLVEAARARLPSAGIAPVLFGNKLGNGIAGAFARRATLGVAMLEDWLAGALDGDQEMAAVGQEAVAGLIGLGPGLTPSGDDVLIGVALALYAVGWGDAAGTLATAFRAAPATATSAISRAHVDAALSGHAGATAHGVISAVLTGEAETFPSLLDRVDRIGHSSGWDTLAGIAVALRTAAPRLA